MEDFSFYLFTLKFCTVLGSVVIEGDFPCIVHLWRSLWLDVSSGIMFAMLCTCDIGISNLYYVCCVMCLNVNVL